MHLFHIPQCIIQNRNVHISDLNGALWGMEEVHCETCKLSNKQSRNSIMPIDDTDLKNVVVGGLILPANC